MAIFDRDDWDSVVERADALMQACVNSIVGEIDLPHLVLCTDLRTAVTTYQGPYVDGLTALVSAEAAARWDTTNDPDTLVEYSVAPLLGPAPGDDAMPRRTAP